MIFYMDYFVDFLTKVDRLIRIISPVTWTSLNFSFLFFLYNSLTLLNNLYIIFRLRKLTLTSLMRTRNHLRNLRFRFRNRSTMYTFFLKIHRVFINTLFNTIKINRWVTQTCFHLIRNSIYYCFVGLTCEEMWLGMM